MAIRSQDFRKLERLVGRSQARALCRKVEARAQQAAGHTNRGTASQRAAALTDAEIAKELVANDRAGWVNEPGKSRAVLVEKGTGCLLLDSKGKVITGAKITLSSKPGINPSVFLQHLKDPDVENFVPHMYLDDKGNVTVGIGTLLPDADAAKTLPFIRRSPKVGATPGHIERAFEAVKNSGLVNARAPAFRNLTSIDLSEANAESRALDDMDEFLRILRRPNYFPDFETYPVTAKMGLLDMAYTLGAAGTRTSYPRFTEAMRHRNFKLAAQQSNRPTLFAKRNGIVRTWLQDAAKKEHFFIQLTCKKQLQVLVR